MRSVWPKRRLPLRSSVESEYVHLMRVHLTSGNRTEGPSSIRLGRALLASELRIGPSPETEAVYLKLLRAELSR